MWIGLGTEDKFGPGYRLKGLLYGGPGNLSDGGSLVTGGWGPRLAQGDTVDMRMTLTGGSLRLEFGLNNSYLGTAFTIDNWTWGQAKPVVSLSSAGESVTISKLEEEQKAEESALQNQEANTVDNDDNKDGENEDSEEYEEKSSATRSSTFVSFFVFFSALVCLIFG